MGAAFSPRTSGGRVSQAGVEGGEWGDGAGARAPSLGLRGASARRYDGSTAPLPSSPPLPPPSPPGTPSLWRDTSGYMSLTAAPRGPWTPQRPPISHAGPRPVHRWGGPAPACPRLRIGLPMPCSALPRQRRPSSGARVLCERRRLRLLRLLLLRVQQSLGGGPVRPVAVAAVVMTSASR